MSHWYESVPESLTIASKPVFGRAPLQMLPKELATLASLPAAIRGYPGVYPATSFHFRKGSIHVGVRASLYCITCTVSINAS